MRTHSSNSSLLWRRACPPSWRGAPLVAVAAPASGTSAAKP